MTHYDRTLIEDLAGVIEGSPIDRAFRARAEARQNAETSYRLLLHPAEPGPASLLERRAVAVFVAALHGEDHVLQHFQALLEQIDGAGPPLSGLLKLQAGQAAQPGPYGRFPQGPLSAEDLDGPVYAVSDPIRAHLGARLSAALEHAHLLVLHPRDASPAAVQALIRAGWTTPGIVVLSQLVAFMSFQIRVVTGLRAAVQSRQPHLERAG